MPDTTREALAQIFGDLLAKHAYTLEIDGLNSVVVDGDISLLELADVFLAEFLVVPRLDSVGTEYGYRHILDNGEMCEHPVGSRKTAVSCAESCPASERPEALERSIPSWSVIPLPEESKP